MDVWIDITEYATKYGVSASTLRRRIRGNSIAYKMEKGKYLLQDSVTALSAAPLFSRVRSGEVRQTIAPATQIPIHRSGITNLHDPVADLMNSHEALPVALQEDYDRLQIENRRLKSQIEELQTLVQVLEAENASGNA